MNTSQAQDTIGGAPSRSAYDPFNQGRSLSRTPEHVAGVAGGLANYFDVDPSLVRIGTAALMLATGPAAVAAYIAAWLVFPDANGKTIIGDDVLPSAVAS